LRRFPKVGLIVGGFAFSIDLPPAHPKRGVFTSVRRHTYFVRITSSSSLV
jgi:hypothetical protein